MATELRQLDLLDRAKAALAQARTVREVKNIRDKAEAIRQYAKAQEECLTIQNYACEVKIRAERKAGELLSANGFGSRGGDRKSRRSVSLDDFGVTRLQSQRWQTIASVPDGDLDQHISSITAAEKELTTASVLSLARSLKGKPEPREWHMFDAMNHLREAARVAIDRSPADARQAIGKFLISLGEEICRIGAVA